MTYTYLLWGLVLVLLAVILYRRVKQAREIMNNTPTGESSCLITLTDENFHETVARGLTLVDFWAPWCAPCRIIGPIVSDLSIQFEGKLKVGKLNVDDNRGTASKYSIRSIPTLILFRDGKIAEQIVGLRPKSAFEKLIQKHLAQ